LDSEPVIDFVVQKTVTLLEEAIRASNYQICLLWSRFLGELYKYNLIRRTYFFDQLSRFLKIGGSEITVINLICTVLETCENYLESKKISQRNQKFLFLVDFKVPDLPLSVTSITALTCPCLNNSKLLRCFNT
jgi:hypothetical protein